MTSSHSSEPTIYPVSNQENTTMTSSSSSWRRRKQAISGLYIREIHLEYNLMTVTSKRNWWPLASVLISIRAGCGTTVSVTAKYNVKPKLYLREYSIILSLLTRLTNIPGIHFLQLYLVCFLTSDCFSNLQLIGSRYFFVHRYIDFLPLPKNLKWRK